MIAAPDLAAALCAYLGYQRAPYPQSDWRAVVDTLGLERAVAIELPMLTVLGEIRAMKPDWHAFSLYRGSEWAVQQVRALHPEIDDRSAKALVWLFSFENR